MLSKSSAVVSDTQVFTYEDMNSWANQIASVLQIKGVGPDSVVALLTGRTPELIAGMLGILKAGEPICLLLLICLLNE